MAWSGSFACEALWTNQPRSMPLGSCSAAPVNIQRPSQTSTQVWLPDLLAHSGVPTTRAGMPTLRQASTSRIDRPVQEASPDSIDSFGLWLARLRPVEYFTFTLPKRAELIFWAASAGVLLPSIIGRQTSRSFLRQGSRGSSRLA